jgi:hypothetical protein
LKTKFAKFAVAALILVLGLGMAVPLHATDAQPKLTIDIRRIAAVGLWGDVHLGDTFTVYNNGTQSVSSLDIGFSRIYRNNVYAVKARDKQGTNLALDTVVNQTGEIYWMRVHFGEALGFNKTYVFTLEWVLGHVITLVASGFEFNFTAAPILTQDVRVANVTFIAAPASAFHLPSGSPYTSITLGGQPALFRQYKPWKAYSEESFIAPYSTVSQYILYVPSAQRDITLHSTGSLSVRDTYNTHNIGIVISTVTVTLPEGASNVMAYDLVGALWTSPQNPAAPYQVQISPRYGNGIAGNFTFTLTYDLPQSKYIKQLSWRGTYNLTFALLNNKDDLLFDSATVKIITPSGVSINDVKTLPQSPLSNPIQYDPTNREFALRGVTGLNNVTVGLALTYSPLWSGFGALPWLAGLEFAIVAFALALRIRRGPELAVPVPVEKLREFVGLYDERLALTRELVVMEEEVARGGLVKHEFRRRTKVMELRLDEINKSLMEVKAEVRVISSHYDELIRKIDRAEAEIEVSRNSMNQVRSQYRAGKTTRETYDSMLNDITKRIDRAEETVETILITLREEAR